MVKIKICGLRRQEDVNYVNALKPDYVGFILTCGFRRSIDKATAKSLKSRLDGNIRAVGVFVDDDIDRINDYVNEGIIDIVQLHGAESPDYCEKINAPVIKYFNPENFEGAEKYGVDYYLFDSGTGTGNTFDWQKIPEYKKPFFLAGGLNCDNISSAIRQVKPFAVDISSGVETDGVKDYNKMKKIMEIIRRTENE